MKKDLTELVFILDKSGSMHGLEKDTIGEFNSLIEKQKKETGEAIVSTVLFSDNSHVIHNRIALNEVPTLTSREYYVDGCTALLDAIGNAINHIIQVRRRTSEEEQPEKTIFIITTDGMENASVEYTYKKIKSMIEYQKEKFGWEFIFLGANIDAAAEAERMGIQREHAVTYCCDSTGINVNYEGLDEAITEIRVKKSLSTNWRRNIDKDYKNRK